MFELPEAQYLLLWLIGFVAPSLVILKIMTKLRIKPEYFYLALFGIFVIATILRATNIYPGKHEPLWVDLGTALISAIFAFVLNKFPSFTKSIFFHLLFLIIITVPHFVYILTGEDIGHPWYIEF
jgi:hypothetical protein